MAAAAAATAGAGGGAVPPAAGGGPVRDFHGFVVKPEFADLYSRFAPIFAAEEAERCDRWAEYMQEVREVVPSLPDEDDASLLQRALSHLGASTRAGDPPPQAAALLQRLSSLVQSGLPMAKRGEFWRLFLGVATKRQEGDYQRLLSEVEELELNCALPTSPIAAPQHSMQPQQAQGQVQGALGAKGVFGTPPQPPYPCPYGQQQYLYPQYLHPQQHPHQHAGAAGCVVHLVADASSAGGGTGAAAAAAAAALGAETLQHHTVDIFSITTLEFDSPDCTPAKVGSLAARTEAGEAESRAEGEAEAAAADTVAEVAAAAAGTPAAEPTAAADGSGATTPPAAPAAGVQASTTLRARTPLPTDGGEAGHEGAAGIPMAAAAGEAAAATTPFQQYSTPASTRATLGCATVASTASSGVGSAGSGGTLFSAGTVLSAAECWRQQDYMSQIDKDLHRTFPGHPCMDADGRAALRRILSAYARRNSAVGYCQGLNFLGATFLLFMAEEDAFWCLCAVIEDLLGSEYFDEKMVLPQVDVLVFGHLLQGRFPTLWRHLQALEVDAASVTMHWFLCCFLNSLPLDSTLRVWDLLFFEGSPVVLFRVALALIEIYDQALMCTRESSDAYMLLQCCAQMTFDSSRLVDTACCGYSHLMPAGLAVLRQRYRPLVMENMRISFSSDEDFHQYLGSHCKQQGQGQGGVGGNNSGNGGGSGGLERGGSGNGGSGAFAFADTFQRVSSALLEVEEAALARQQQAAVAAAAGGSSSRVGSPGDSGHLSLPSRASSASGSSNRASSRGGGSYIGGGGSQAASPLARMRQAVTGLTARLMPSSLPPMLPAGALAADGHELSPLSTSRSAGAAGAEGRRQLAGAGGAAAGSARRGTSCSAFDLPPLAPQPPPTAAAAGGELGTAEAGRAGAGAGAGAEKPPPRPHLRCISTDGRSGGSSPSASLSRSAGSGASLGRGPAGLVLTPFSEVSAAMLAAASQLQLPPRQRQAGSGCGGGGGGGGGSAATSLGSDASTPHGSFTLTAHPAWALSQPVTPATQQHAPHPPPTHRRAMTAGHYSHPQGGRSRRRRRRLTIDLLNLADVRPDLQQPAVAAAFAIAANPSPGARGGARVHGSGGASGANANPSLPLRQSAPAVAALGPADPAGALAAAGLLGGSAANSSSAGGVCSSSNGSSGDGSGGGVGALPVRTLLFDDADDQEEEVEGEGGATGDDAGEEESDDEDAVCSGDAARWRRAMSAPPVALLAPAHPPPAAAIAADGADTLEVQRGTAGAADEVAASSSQAPSQGSCQSCDAAGPHTAAAAAAAAEAAETAQEVSSASPPSQACSRCEGGGGGTSGAGISGRNGKGGTGATDCEPLPLPSPGRPPRPPNANAQALTPNRGQTPALLAVVAQLQEEVAVAESRRHAAEVEAQQAQQTAADLAQQLKKVQDLVSDKEALLAELSSKVASSCAALAEINGELAAKHMALQAEEAAAEQRRRQLAAADALIKRLMDAVAQGRKQGGTLGAGGGSASANGGGSPVGNGGGRRRAGGGGGNGGRGEAGPPGGSSCDTSSSGSTPQSSSGSVASRK